MKLLAPTALALSFIGLASGSTAHAENIESVNMNTTAQILATSSDSIYENAKEIQVNEVYKAKMSQYSDSHYYKVYSGSYDHLAINASSDISDFNVDVYDAKYLTAGTRRYFNEVEVTSTVPNSWYYIRVSKKQGFTYNNTPYELRANW